MDVRADFHPARPADFGELSRAEAKSKGGVKMRRQGARGVLRVAGALFAAGIMLQLSGCDDGDGGYTPGPADLSDVVVSAGTLSPAFTPGTTFYTVEGILPSTVTVTPFAWDPAATITVDGAPVASGTPSSPIDLSLGMNTITILVTATDGVTLNSHTILFFRGGPQAQEAYLKASNTDASDWFGVAVAVDGDTVVVGSYGEDSNETGMTGTGADNSATYSGAAYVFVRSGGVWQQEAYLKASNTDAGDGFGCAVAVDSDTVVVGAYGEASNETGTSGSGADDSAQDSGAAYVFVRSGGVWTQEAYLKASNTGWDDRFGYAVAVAGDTVVVGARFEDSNETGTAGTGADNSALNSGAAYVFVRSGGVWQQEAYLKASNTDAQDCFGYAVAIADDTMVVGAWFEGSNETGTAGTGAANSAPASGAAYVFVRSGGVWTQEAYLKASNTDADDYFGYAVAVDGDTVVVGASGEGSNETGTAGTGADNSASGSGAAYVFVRSGGVWTQEAYLKASNTDANDLFGCAVAVAADTVVVGAHFEDSSETGTTGTGADNSATYSGAAYVFK